MYDDTGAEYEASKYNEERGYHDHGDDDCACAGCAQGHAIINTLLNAVEAIEREFALPRPATVGYLMMVQKLVLDNSIRGTAMESE